MAKIRYTRHARRRMKWRRISTAEVEAVISAPDTRVPHDADRTIINAQKHIGRRKILVGYRKSKNEVVILTAVSKR